MNTSCTSSNFPMNPFFSTLFPNLTSQQQQQQQLFTQLLLSGRSISFFIFLRWFNFNFIHYQEQVVLHYYHIIIILLQMPYNYFSIIVLSFFNNKIFVSSSSLYVIMHFRFLFLKHFLPYQHLSIITKCKNS
jgi:hypothetical protein